MSEQINTANILLIEGSPDDVFFFTSSAAKLRIGRVAHVDNGEEAKKLLSKTSSPPAVIVTELKLPRCGGVELLTWIRSQRHLVSIPVIVLSSSGLAKDKKAAYSAGANVYFIKPSRFSEYDVLWKTIIGFIKRPTIDGDPLESNSD